MAFRFGAKSDANLIGVHKELVLVARHAISISEIDFGITQGLRTLAEQEKYVAAGASKTMNSRHLTGHAVDVVAFIGRQARWDFELYYKIASAFRTAAQFHRIPIRWGACWERIDNNNSPLEDLVTSYVQRCKSSGRKPLMDGPHFELPKALYP